MDALRAVLERAGLAVVGLAAGAVVICAPFVGFAMWGDHKVRRTKQSLVHDPKDR